MQFENFIIMDRQIDNTLHYYIVLIVNQLHIKNIKQR
jgi:hypothetical protein